MKTRMIAFLVVGLLALVGCNKEEAADGDAKAGEAAAGKDETGITKENAAAEAAKLEAELAAEGNE